MRRNHHLRTTVSAAVVGAVVFGFAGVAAAQEAPTTIDDIIVTAQKREQSLQDVPIVVTTLSQELLQGYAQECCTPDLVFPPYFPAYSPSLRCTPSTFA